MKNSREWSEIKKDFEALIGGMGKEEIEKACEIMTRRIFRVDAEINREMIKKLKIGDKVKYFSRRGSPDAPKEPDLQGIIRSVNLDHPATLWIENENGRIDIKRPMDVRKVAERAIEEADMKDWLPKKKRLRTLLREMDVIELMRAKKILGRRVVFFTTSEYKG